MREDRKGCLTPLLAAIPAFPQLVSACTPARTAFLPPSACYTPSYTPCVCCTPTLDFLSLLIIYSVCLLVFQLPRCGFN
ncbi:hypothetical protein FB451DRAFT_44415 [Mycena latifolia]|nr:hypothetical protein FB451DRAFT_44415 [Mycena latifolia]